MEIKLNYFTKDEFVMGDKNVYSNMDKVFLFTLDKLRENIGTPLVINSSYRDKEYNEAIGGSKNSMHLKGRAVDIHCKNGVLRAKILKEALYLGMSCGVYKNWIHVDNRENQIVYHG